jgi:mono/diheme cytochrome c family protein
MKCEIVNIEHTPWNAGGPDPRRAATLLPTAMLAALLLATTGCDLRDMYDQDYYRPLQESSFFGDGQSARPLEAGTVARGHLQEDVELYTGQRDGKPIPKLPESVVLDEALLARGQERYDIYCAVCHDRTGSGNGMIVQRGFRRPPTYHQPRLQEAPAGHIFDVISKGFGAMPSYAVQILPRDRWAIVAYVRALQLSQNARMEDVPAEERKKLEGADATSR